MGSAGSTAQFTQLLAATLDAHGRQAIDQIFERIPTIKHLMNKGRVSWDGSGAYYRSPLTYATSTASGWTSNYKKLNTTPQTFIGEVVFDMKRAYASITYSQDEVDKNRGDKALVKLVTAKIDQAKNTIMDDLNQALFASTVATDAMNSLTTTVDSTGTIGGINQSTYSWWAAHEASVGSFAAGGLAAMDTAWNTVSKGKKSGQPDLIITTQTIFQYFQQALRAHGMDYYAKRSDLGVPAIEYNGVPVIWDPDCNSGEMYFLNSQSLGLAVDGTANMKMTEMVKPADQLAYVGQCYIRLQLICKERRGQGKLTGITA